MTHDELQEDLACHLRAGTENEVWRPVNGYEGLYEVSNHGRMKSLAKLVVRHIKGVYREFHYSERIRDTKPATNGYVYVDVVKNEKVRRVPVHHLVLTAFVSAKPLGMECRHGNNIRSDNRLSNISWGTNVENAGDRVSSGTYAVGDTHPLAKFTEVQIASMQSDAKGMPRRAVREKYGISKSHLARVLCGVSRSSRIHGEASHDA
nr:NUMOD4 domain-containing protein [uncultured Rhodoferax sp.]